MRQTKDILMETLPLKINCFSFFQCRTEILTKRMTNGRDVYRGVNALQAKINLIERYRNRK